MSSAIFYRAQRRPSTSCKMIAPNLDSTIRLLMVVDAESERAELELKYRRGRVTRFAALLSITTTLLAAVTWPPVTHPTYTKRVWWNECDGLLTIYGNRCN